MGAGTGSRCVVVDPAPPVGGEDPHVVAAGGADGAGIDRDDAGVGGDADAQVGREVLERRARGAGRTPTSRGTGAARRRRPRSRRRGPARRCRRDGRPARRRGPSARHRRSRERLEQRRDPVRRRVPATRGSPSSRTNSGTTRSASPAGGVQRRVVVDAQVTREQDDGGAHDGSPRMAVAATRARGGRDPRGTDRRPSADRGADPPSGPPRCHALGVPSPRDRRRPRALQPARPGVVPDHLRRAHGRPAPGLAGHRRRRPHPDPRADRVGQDADRVPRRHRPAGVGTRPAEGRAAAGRLPVAAAGARRRRRPQPPRAARGHPAGRRTVRGHRAPARGRRADRGHLGARPRPDEADPARRAHHHPGVAVPAADLAGARDAASRPDRHRRRDPRHGGHQARQPPRADASNGSSTRSGSAGWPTGRTRARHRSASRCPRPSARSRRSRASSAAPPWAPTGPRRRAR